MDFEKIKKIHSYVKKIVKFKKLDEYKNMSNKQFHNKMKKIFPKFNDEYSKVFEMVTHNKDLKFLKLMFKKLDDIENEYDARYNESNNLRPIIKEIRNLINKKNNITKADIVKYIENNNSDFINKYPIIIDRLLDDDYKNYKADELLLEQIKYNHEVIIGNELAKKYIYPKVN